MWDAERNDSSRRLLAALSVAVCVVLACGVAIGLVFAVLLQLLLRDTDGGGHGGAPAPSPGPVAPLADTGYMCQLPLSYTALPYATTWVIIGDEFAAGAGVDAAVSWVSLLRATNKVRSGVQPAVLNVAQQGGSIAQQAAAALSSSALQQALANREGVLVFVSYGVTKLESEVGTNYAYGDARLYELVDELAPIANLSHIEGVQVVLVMRPDPVYGGVLVPLALQQCPDALAALNYPTLQARAAHLSIYGAVREAYSVLARSEGVGLVEVDAALGRYAWPFAKVRTDCAFADCALYNSMGQSLLADMLWHCMRRERYLSPT